MVSTSSSGNPAAVSLRVYTCLTCVDATLSALGDIGDCGPVAMEWLLISVEVINSPRRFRGVNAGSDAALEAVDFGIALQGWIELLSDACQAAGCSSQNAIRLACDSPRRAGQGFKKPGGGPRRVQTPQAWVCGAPAGFLKGLPHAPPL